MFLSSPLSDEKNTKRHTTRFSCFPPALDILESRARRAISPVPSVALPGLRRTSMLPQRGNIQKSHFIVCLFGRADLKALTVEQRELILDKFTQSRRLCQLPFRFCAIGQRFCHSESGRWNCIVMKPYSPISVLKTILALPPIFTITGSPPKLRTMTCMYPFRPIASPCLIVNAKPSSRGGSFA